MNRFLHLVFTIAVMAMSALPSVANNLKLYGKVTARGEGAVPFAAVGVEGGKFGTYTNDNGDYELELPLGRYVLVFTAMGYEPIRKEVYADENAYLSGGKYDMRVDYNKNFLYKANGETYFAATVPEGHVFVLGDNRNGSSDSRTSRVGFVDVDTILGKAVIRLSPFTVLD